MEKVNLKKLAEVLNISISTVSKALHNSHEISEETKQKVMAKAEELGYHPNPYAGSLRHHKTNTIAIVVPQLNNYFFIQAISGAESKSQEAGYHTLIYNSNDDISKEASIMHQLQNGRVDGIILSLSLSTNTYQHLHSIIQSGIPIVFFDRVCHEIETAKVITDDYLSGFKATEHLISNGSRDIAYLSIGKSISIDNKRMQGYMEALSKHNITLDESKRVIECTGTKEIRYNKIHQLLSQKKRPSGIFCCVEALALICYEVCRELKIRIPEDVKIISFSNLPSAHLLSPALTTITQPAHEMGLQSAALLIKYLENKKFVITNENHVLRSELVVRGSTK